jgi:hypothetical protein
MAFSSNANTRLDPNNQLNGQQVVLRDQQHAAKLFATEQFRLAPKQAFLFHVSFSINTAALKTADMVQRYGQEINMLVKSCDLPSFKVKTETLNQYNRKKVVQYSHEYTEIGVKFHDDNMNLINLLWQNYYSYYYADSNSARNSGAYNRTATRNGNFITTPYGFDNSSTTPFFNSITIYQMARHEYASYKLVNPIITSWSHNKLDYSTTTPKDLDMKLQYEAVVYDQGLVGNGIPEGFGQTHYDHAPSPLKGPNPDASVNMPSFATNINTGALAPGILNNAIQTAQNYQSNNNNGTPGSGILNTVGQIGLGVAAFGIGSQLLSGLGGISGIASGIGGAVSSIASGISGAVSGLADAVFPKEVGIDAEAAVPDAEYTTDSLGNSYKDGQFYRAADVPEDGDGAPTNPDTGPASNPESSGNIGDAGGGSGSVSDPYDF